MSKVERFLRVMEKKWAGLPLDRERTVLIENRAIAGSKKICFSFFSLTTRSADEEVSFLLENGEKNDVLRTVFAAFVRARPGTICSRDPGLLTLLRKRGLETNGTKCEMVFHDRLVKKTKHESVPLVLLLNRFFEKKAQDVMNDSNLVFDDSNVGENDESVVFDSVLGGYKSENTESRTHLFHICQNCNKTNASLACNDCSYTFYCSVRCALDNEESHHEECESFCEHADDAIEVDLKSGEIFSFRGTKEATILNKMNPGYQYNGFSGVADMKQLGGPDKMSYLVKLYSIEGNAIPSKPIWIHKDCLVSDGTKIHSIVFEWARLKSKLVRVLCSRTETLTSKSVDDKEFDAFLERVNKMIQSAQFDKALEAFVRLDDSMFCCADDSDTMARFVCLKNAVSRLLSSRASSSVMSFIESEKEESKLKSAIQDCQIGLEEKEHLKDENVEVLEYWLSQANKLMPERGEEDEDPEEDDGDTKTKKKKRRHRKKRR